MRDLHPQDILLTAQRDRRDAQNERKRGFISGVPLLLSAVFLGVSLQLTPSEKVPDPKISQEKEDIVAGIFDKEIAPQKEALRTQFNAEPHGTFTFLLEGREITIDRDAIHAEALQKDSPHKVGSGGDLIPVILGSLGVYYILYGLGAHKKIKKLDTQIAGHVPTKTL